MPITFYNMYVDYIYTGYRAEKAYFPFWEPEVYLQDLHVMPQYWLR